MNYKVEATPQFLAEAKRLAKRYLSLRDDIATLAEVLSNNPNQGTALGGGAYKIRMAITSKGKGKSGGARIITCVKVMSARVYLVSIYDKSEHSDISDHVLKDRIRNLPE